jgi:hypothetical protein
MLRPQQSFFILDPTTMTHTNELPFSHHLERRKRQRKIFLNFEGTTFFFLNAIRWNNLYAVSQNAFSPGHAKKNNRRELLF